MSKTGTSIQYYLPLVTRISFGWYYQLTLSLNNTKFLGMDSHFCFDLYYTFPQHNKNHSNLKSPCKKWTVLLLYKLMNCCGRETAFIKKCYHVWLITHKKFWANLAKLYMFCTSALDKESQRCFSAFEQLQ